MHPRELLIALGSSERIHRPALCRLAADPDRWQHLSPTADLESRASALGVPAKQLRRALLIRARAEETAERETRRAERRDCRLITRFDADYPRSLLDLALPPPLLYCRGVLPAGTAVAIIGSRLMDDYGRQAARWFAEQLAVAGVAIVSGFARGIDTTAHQATLDAGGRTVAVLGCGIDIDYPSGNAPLAEEIRHSGAMISEFPFGAEPRAWRFPIRNRVIAALAVGTLVVEATIRSGSLITAHHALDLGRDVYAVPGRIFDERSSGTNALIADGALPARCPRDVLESLSLGVQQELFATVAKPSPGPAVPIQEEKTKPLETPTSAPPSRPEPAPPGGLPGRVLQALHTERGLTVEEIATQIDTAVEEVLGALLELELIGRARRAPGPVYLR